MGPRVLADGQIPRIMAEQIYRLFGLLFYGSIIVEHRFSGRSGRISDLADIGLSDRVRAVSFHFIIFHDQGIDLRPMAAEYYPRLRCRPYPKAAPIFLLCPVLYLPEIPRFGRFPE